MAIMAQNINQKPGYKQTEVGVIPEDWDVKKFEGIGECIIGLTYKPSNVKSDGLLVLRSSNIAGNELIFTDNVFVNIKVADKLIVRKDDILICVRNGSRSLIGKCALVDDKAKGMTFGAFMSVFRTEYAHFIFYQFQSNLIRNQIHEHIGATINQITNKSLNSFQIPFPKKKQERDAIATALSDVDALITSLDKLIAKKRDIKQATMQQLLTGKMRLPGFSKELKPAYKQTDIGLIPTDWNVCSVKEIADVTTGDKDTQDRTESGAYPFFVRSQIIERINSYSYDGEAVLTAGDGVGVGKVFHYVNGKFDFHQRVYMICNFRNFDGFFFYLYFSNYFSKEATKYNAKNSVDSVRREMVTGMKIPYPPLREQHAIATVLTDMDAEIATLEQRREKTRMLKQGMMQELLTGKTRLV